MIIASKLFWGGIGVAAALLATQGLIPLTVIAYKTVAGPQPYSLTVEQLVYKDGMFGQKMGVTGIKALPGDWSAEIDRDGKTLCRGAGHGLYDQDEYQQVKFFTPNEWTGAICPELKSGDIGRAVWTYTNVNGLRVHVSGEVRVP